MIPKQIQPKLNELAREYAEKLYASAKEVLSKDEFRNTGELVDSLRVSIIPCRDDAPPEIVLEYADQGYYIGYKKPQWTRVPNIEKIRKWAESINFTGPVPGYKGDASSLPPWKAKERIISAIAWNKRKFDTWKAKPWKGRRGIDLGKLLRSLNEEVLDAWARKVEEILASSIEDGTVLS